MNMKHIDFLFASSSIIIMLLIINDLIELIIEYVSSLYLQVSPSSFDLLEICLGIILLIFMISLMIEILYIKTKSGE